MATVFRAKYLAGRQHAFDAGPLTFAGGTTVLVDRHAFAGFLGQGRAVDWVVYAKRPFAATRPVGGRVPRGRARRLIYRPRACPLAPEADADGITRPALTSTLGRLGRKSLRVTPEPPYNPHNVAAAPPRGFVQQG